MCDFRSFSAFAFAAVLALAPNIAGAAEAPEQQPRPELQSRIEALVAKLSSDDFSVRNEALRKLEALAADRASSAQVRRAIEGRLAAKPVDWEARALLESVRRRLPEAAQAVKPNDLATPEAIDAIFQDLESNRFADREQAAERLKPAAVHPATCGLVMLRIKKRFDNPSLDLESVRRLAPLWSDSWGTWLLSATETTAKAPAGEALGTAPMQITDKQIADKITDKQITEQVDRLIVSSPPNQPTAHPLLAPSAAAERELLYYLAREDVSPRVCAALEQRLKQAAAQGLGPEAFDRLQRVFDWSRPAMVAEYWQMGEQKSMQHLLIGVPNQPAGALNASLFDRCDEKFAHCVSGNSLSPGDWPVGIFFPHPSAMQGDAQFHLKNLPTPRRRLAYEYEVPTAMSREKQLTIDTARRKQISRRTCAHWVEAKRELTDREVDMLEQLDPDEVSRFVGPYLQGVPDRRLENGSPTAFGNGSAHGNLCYKLSLIGTAEAGPALIGAIEKRRVLEPTTATPYRMDWICLFVLGERVGWPGLDDWLVAQLDRTDAISIREPSVADVGASAAALLVQRHGRTPSEFGLERQMFAELIDLENPGFRFSKPEGRADVKKWWLQTKEAERKVAP
ncbi:MAG: hypothetical protein K8U03_24690 [Planctomycetia bacterium]|nr:hypothetical protein [Planctomycetia bacterium]